MVAGKEARAIAGSERFGQLIKDLSKDSDELLNHGGHLLENPNTLESFKKRAAQVITKHKQIIETLKKKLRQELVRRKKLEEDKVREVESIRREVEIERMKNVQLSVELQKQNFTKKEISSIENMSVAELQITQLKEQLKLEMTRANRKILEQEEKISTMEIQFESAKNKLELQLNDTQKKNVALETKFETEMSEKDKMIATQKKELEYRESMIVEKMDITLVKEKKIVELEGLIVSLKKEIADFSEKYKGDLQAKDEEIRKRDQIISSLDEEKKYLFTLTQDYDVVALTRSIEEFKQAIGKITINEPQARIQELYKQSQDLVEQLQHIDKKLYDGLSVVTFELNEIENQLKCRIVINETEITAA